MEGSTDRSAMTHRVTFESAKKMGKLEYFGCCSHRLILTVDEHSILRSPKFG